MSELLNPVSSIRKVHFGNVLSRISFWWAGMELYKSWSTKQQRVHFSHYLQHPFFFFPLLLLYDSSSIWHCLLFSTRSADHGLTKPSLLRYCHPEVNYTRGQRHSLALCQITFLRRQYLTSAVNPHLWKKHGLNELHTDPHKSLPFLPHTSKLPYKLIAMQVPISERDLHVLFRNISKTEKLIFLNFTVTSFNSLATDVTDELDGVDLKALCWILSAIHRYGNPWAHTASLISTLRY